MLGWGASKLTRPAANHDADFGPELSEAGLDAWSARNRDVSNAWLDEARRPIAQGEVDEQTFAEVIVQGARRRLAKR